MLISRKIFDNKYLKLLEQPIKPPGLQEHRENITDKEMESSNSILTQKDDSELFEDAQILHDQLEFEWLDQIL